MTIPNIVFRPASPAFQPTQLYLLQFTSNSSKYLPAPQRASLSHHNDLRTSPNSPQDFVGVTRTVAKIPLLTWSSVMNWACPPRSCTFGTALVTTEYPTMLAIMFVSSAPRPWILVGRWITAWRFKFFKTSPRCLSRPIPMLRSHLSYHPGVESQGRRSWEDWNCF